MNRALFLDRDGVINIDHDYVCRREDFVFMPGIFELILAFMSRHYLPIIITNQSGIARGFYTEAQFQTLTAWMLEAFAQKGIRFAQVYHCPHGPEDGCSCRKPGAGMILKAKRDHDIDLTHSWLIGDKENDITAGINGGVGRTILLKGKRGERYEESRADFVVDSLQVVQNMLKETDAVQ